MSEQVTSASLGTRSPMDKEGKCLPDSEPQLVGAGTADSCSKSTLDQSQG